MRSIMHKDLKTEPSLPSELSVTAPVAFDAIVREAMAMLRNERHASADEFTRAILISSDDSAGVREFRSSDPFTVSTVAPCIPTVERPEVRFANVAAMAGVLRDSIEHADLPDPAAPGDFVTSSPNAAEAMAQIAPSPAFPSF